MRRSLTFILIVSSALFLTGYPVEVYGLSQGGDGPGLRSAQGMTFDPHNNVTVLYGGSSSGGGINSLSDTWFYEFSANAWTKHVGLSPPARANTAMVYCSQTNEIILFGGDGVTDTWSFDCGTQTWSEVETTTNPGVHHSLAMAYDPVQNVVILFGGFDDQGMTTDDTWSFDCETREWTELFPSVFPLARYGHVMTYDTNISKIILACGNTRDQGHQDDTWRYDTSTNTWVEIDPLGGPDRLKWASMVYDSINQKNILFGGQVSNAAVDETQIYDAHSNRWTNPHPDESPAARINTGLAFDSKYGVVIMYGGLLIDEGEDLWIQFGDTWAYSFDENTWTELIHAPNSGTTNTLLAPDMILALIVVLGAVGTLILMYLVRSRDKSG